MRLEDLPEMLLKKRNTHELNYYYFIIIIIPFCSFVGKAADYGTYKSHFDGLLEKFKWKWGK